MSNEKNEAPFVNVKIGDKVYSPAFGWGVVTGNKLSERYPIQVDFRMEGVTSDYSPQYVVHEFDHEGKLVPTGDQILFWTVPVITPQKHKVQKTLKGFVPVFGSPHGGDFWFGELVYDTERECNETQCCDSSYRGCAPVFFEYEVEIG